MTVRLIGQEESFEVRYSDGRPSKYFYFDEHPGPRAITKRASKEVALSDAKGFPRSEHTRGERARASRRTTRQIHRHQTIFFALPSEGLPHRRFALAGAAT